jgi:hypothetical protein
MDWSNVIAAILAVAIWVGISWYANRNKPPMERRRWAMIEAAIAITMVALVSLWRLI